MIGSLWCGASGMRAQQLQVDSLANDVANMNTAGYKRRRVEFAELVQRSIIEGGIPVERSQEMALIPTLGAGVKAVSQELDFSQGVLIATGEPLELAIQGKGYFTVIGPGGEWYLTRNGNFYREHEGNLVTAGGYRLDMPFELPPEAEKVTISSDGNITAVIDGERQELGELSLAQVPNPGGLEAVGNSLYRETEASGMFLTGRTGTEGLGKLRSGYLEGSNVDLAATMTKVILAQRAYELSSRTVRTADEMWGLANNLRG